MINPLTRTANLIETFNERLGQMIAWLTLLMTLITFLVVVLRYGFDAGWIALQESITYMHATVFMLGAAYTLKHNEHVRVDIFYQKFSPKAQAWVNLLGTVILLIPVAFFIFWTSLDYVSASWGYLEGSREAGGLPFIFLLKTLIPIIAILLLLQGVAIICRSIPKVKTTGQAPS